jgi:hypothetical protein
VGGEFSPFCRNLKLKKNEYSFRKKFPFVLKNIIKKFAKKGKNGILKD